MTSDDFYDDILVLELEETEKEEEAKTIKPSPTITLPPGEIDPRLKLISHSSRTTLHTCPRKLQLHRLNGVNHQGQCLLCTLQAFFLRQTDLP